MFNFRAEVATLPTRRKLWPLVAVAVVATVVIAALGAPLLVGATFANGQQCPPSGEDGWTKIEGSDLSSHPVDGATDYCFKAGNFIVGSIPEGGFGQEGACEAENVQNCGLSHWAYRIVPPTSTPPPTNTPPPTETPPEPTPTDTPEPTPTDTPTPGPSPTPEDTPTPGPSPTPTETPTEPTPTPTPTDPPEEPTPTPTSTKPPRDPTPTATHLPKTGPDDENVWGNEPWLCWGDNVWCAHNGVDGSPAQDWVFLWEGQTFEFAGETYQVALVEQVQPDDTEVLEKASDYDVVLITCRNWTPSGAWLDRLVVFANALTDN